MIEGVAKELVPAVWPHVEHLVARAIDQERWGSADVKGRLCEGKMQLWLIGNGRVEAIAVTEINVYPRCTECSLPIVAGVNREAWIDHLDDIEAWAKAQGCRWMLAPSARPGWLREKRLKGWKRVGTIMQKEIGNAARIAA